MRAKPLILISNDDGYEAKGLHALISALEDLGELYVMAPSGPRSGYACSISMDTPVTCKVLADTGDIHLYSCSGTPVDCVKLALFRMAPRVPSLVIGGINHGDNSAINTHYSGTMGVAFEGCMKQIPSIAFSVCSHDSDIDFTPTFPYIRNIVQNVLRHKLPLWTCLNVNFPLLPSFQGIRICRMTYGVWEKEWEERNTPQGNTCYKMKGIFSNLENEATDTDRWALSHGYVAITPTQLDVTAYQLKDTLTQWDFEP